MRKMQNLFGGRTKMPPAIIPEKAIILHTLEDAGIVTHRDICSATSFQHEVKQRSIEKTADSP